MDGLDNDYYSARPSSLHAWLLWWLAYKGVTQRQKQG